MEDKYFTLTEVISILKIGYPTLLRKIKSKEIRAIKVGRSWRVSETQINKLTEYDESR